FGVADLCLDVRGPAPDFHMVGRDDDVHLAIQQHVYSGTKIVTRNHARSPDGSVPGAWGRCQRRHAGDAAPGLRTYGTICPRSARATSNKYTSTPENVTALTSW